MNRPLAVSRLDPTFYLRMQRHLYGAARHYDQRSDAEPCPGAAACWVGLAADARSLGDRMIVRRLS